MADKYDLPPYVLSRVRYYDGEYLKDDEFIDEQKYHIDRKQRHDRLLHVAGVCEGLVASLVNATTLKVTAGTAIDDEGHTILLSADQTIAVKPEHNGALLVQILFKELEDRPADANSAVASTTRFTQAPVLVLAAAAEKHAVVLGQAIISNGTASQVTPNGRVYSGLRLPGPGNAGYVLHARGDTVPGLVDLECSLNITGKLQVSGSRIENKSGLGIVQTDANDWLRVNPDSSYPGTAIYKPVAIGSGGLSIGDWSQLPQGQLKVTSDASILGNLSFGSSVRQMLNLWQTYYGIGVQDSTLYFRTGKNVAFYKGGSHNDGALNAGNGGTPMLTIEDGNVGIGTANPVKTLEVNGNAFVKSGLVANGINIGTSGTQTTYNYAYESLGTDSPSHNLRLFSRRGMYVHAPQGFIISKEEGGRGDIGVEGTLSFGATVRQMINLWGTNYGIGVQDSTLYFRTGQNVVFYRDGTHNNGALNAGGGSTMMTLSNGNLSVAGNAQVNGYIRLNNPTNPNISFRMHYESGNDTVVFYHNSGKGQFMRQDGAWHQNSDRSLKENILTLEGTLDRVMQLRPVSFDWKSGHENGIGFVAQDVEEVFPELVSTHRSEDGTTLKGLPYASFSVLAIAAIKELNDRYDRRIATLEQKISTLRFELETDAEK